MSNDPLALPGNPGLPQEADYDAMYAAVAATERGRRFLLEYARRSRGADPNHEDAVIAATQRLAKIAAELRDRVTASPLSDALDAAVRDLGAVVSNGATRHDGVNGMGAQTEPVPPLRPAESAADESIPSSAGIDSKEFAAAASALAASFNALINADKTAKAEFISSPITIPELDYQSTPVPPSADAKNPPRWFIEPPEFVFEPAKRQADRQNGSMESRPLQAEPPSSPQDDPGDLFESVPAHGNALPHSRPQPPPHVLPMPTNAAPPTSIASAVVESKESRPPHAPTVPVVRAVPRPAPIDPLAALRALSEEELIALFG